MESTPKAWLHMASFGSQSSATPTPSASALRRAAAAIQTDTHAHAHGSFSGTGSKISAILGTVGGSSRGAGVGVYSSPRSHTRSDSAQQTTSSSTSGGISSAASATMSALNLAVTHSSLKNTPARSQSPYDGTGWGVIPLGLVPARLLFLPPSPPWEILVAPRKTTHEVSSLCMSFLCSTATSSVYPEKT